MALFGKTPSESQPSTPIEERRKGLPREGEIEDATHVAERALDDKSNYNETPLQPGDKDSFYEQHPELKRAEGEGNFGVPAAEKKPVDTAISTETYLKMMKAGEGESPQDVLERMVNSSEVISPVEEMDILMNIKKIEGNS